MEVRTTTTPNRRAPIPRPWLSKHRHSSPDSPKETNFDILEKPQWSISWTKLSTCFCIKEQSKDQRHHDVPFPAFPAIRRNSFSSCELYQSGGSVSSFTESDTSSYSSVTTTAEAPETIQQRAVTPPPVPISKPPTIAARSRSAGLPPLKPSSSVSTPPQRSSVYTHTPTQPSSVATPTQPIGGRNRCDTGEFTRTSATTNTSRHRRRLEQFQFSPISLKQIWKETDEKVIPPSFVLCQEQQQSQHQEPYQLRRDRRDSGCISALEMDDLDIEDWGDYNGDGDDEQSHSPFAQLERKIAEEKNRQEWQKPPKATRQKDKQRRQKPQRTPERERAMVPVYLRKSPALDHITDGNLALSGWIAISLGNNLLETRLQEGSKMKASDMYYMRIVEANGQASILLHKSDGHLEHSLTLQREWMCESRELSSRAGRCVTLRSRATATSIATLLPVSLDDTFFTSGELVSSKKFSSIQHTLFVGGKGKVYAPDEQHDAAMYIMFSLDALIKNCGT